MMPAREPLEAGTAKNAEDVDKVDAGEHGPLSGGHAANENATRHSRGRGKAVQEVLDIYHWTIWLTLAVGVTLIVLAYNLWRAPCPLRDVLSALGAIVFSAGALGVLLNALWWRSWAVRAMAELFSDRSLIEKLHLSHDELQERCHLMISSVYGADLPSSRFRESFDRDVLARLNYPIRREMEVDYDLGLEVVQLAGSRSDVARVHRQIRYVLHNYSQRRVNPFPDGLVVSGFVDVPDVLLQAWDVRRGEDARDSEAGRKILAELCSEARAFEFNYLSINGKKLVGAETHLLREGQTAAPSGAVRGGQGALPADYRLESSYDGQKREPDIVFRAKLTQDSSTRYALDAGQEMHIVCSFSCIHNMSSYILSMMAQPAEGAVFHYCWDPSIFYGTMRYFVPPYWGNRERELTKVSERQLIFYVNTTLLPGHGILVSWRPLPSMFSSEHTTGISISAPQAPQATAGREVKHLSGEQAEPKEGGVCS